MSKKVYFVGIEGAGMSALAVLYSNLGYEVLGSDDGDHFYGDNLKKNGIKVFDSYNAGNLPDDVSEVVYSTALGEDNVEIIEAKSRKVKLESYPKALANLFNKKMGIAVCGTHGKTTTTAMLSLVLDKLDLRPMAIVGSKVADWDGNSLSGDGGYFVIEADEYQNKLSYYNPWSVILTSVDYDHPDFFKTPEDYKKSFSDFVKKIPKHGNLIYFNDSRNVVDVADHVKCSQVSYGFSDGSDYLIKNYKVKEKSFEVLYKEKLLGEFGLKLPGRHNALNATAGIAFCHQLKLDLDIVKKVLKNFRGTARRFERVGKKNDAILIDDYAHHPEEVRATLKTAKEFFPDKNIIAVFHPHTFTRTEALIDDFAQSFGDANNVIVIDIFGSSRESAGKVHSRDLVEAINQCDPRKARYIATIEEVTDALNNSIGENDVVISMGAGDVWRVTHELAK